MDYQSCLDYLHRNCTRNVPGGFERTKRMAELVGNPQEKLRIIHISGTNGKGSTAAMICSMLQRAGYRTGLFTSPHLERYEERIQLNGQMISEDAFAIIFTRLIESIIPRLLREGMHHPGEFELLTVAGWMYFKDKTDFVISEVGLGGTLDPTNIITSPILTVITPVSLDHCQILGNTIESIAKEKAGILKEGVPVIVAPQKPEGLRVIQAKADELKVPVMALSMQDITPIETGMAGAYQQMNSHTALAAIRNLKSRKIVQIDEETMMQGLKTAFWPGRMEHLEVGENRAILMDGAHNPAGMESLAENLRNLYADKKIVLFLSILDDKEQLTMLKEILPLASAVALTSPETSSRAQNWKMIEQRIYELAPEIPCRMYEDYKQGITAEISRLKAGELLCITGSLYLLGDCRKLLHEYIK